MLDYIKRFLVVLVIAACIGVLFIGGRSTKAMENSSGFFYAPNTPLQDISNQ